MSRRFLTGAREWAQRSPRWFAASAAALLLCLAVLLSLANLPQPVSGVDDTFANLLRNLITAATLATLAYLWFYFWTGERATRHLLRAAQKTPERLFPNPDEATAVELIYGRERLVEEIATALSRQAASGPQIVVGPSGAGKTTLLLALAADLARKKRVLPIVLSLRDPDNDLTLHGFTELAIRRFHEQIDPYIKTEAEADKLWRWMRNRRQIVVLADDLDRSATTDDPYKTRVRLALDAARRRNLPLVIATRPSGLPPDLLEPPIELSQRRLESTSMEPWKYVLWRAGRSSTDADAGRLAAAYVEAGELSENAFYLSLLAKLLRADAIGAAPPADKQDVRVALLDAEHASLTGEDSLHPTETAQRREALKRVEQLAAAWLSPKSERGFQEPWLAAIHDGERFGLLSLDEQGRPQFRHEVLHAYFASRAIADGDPGWRPALQRTPNSPRVQLALIFAAARRCNSDYCRSACDVLLADASAITADQRLLRAAAAAEVSRAGDFGERNDDIANRCASEKPKAGPVAKHVALDQLGRLGGGAAVRALWGYGSDEDYEVRWAAVEKLVDRCSAATDDLGKGVRPAGVDTYRELDPEIEQALDSAMPILSWPQEERPDDWAPEIVALKQMAWLLPALRTGIADEEANGTIDQRLEALLHLERNRVTLQRGLEASIAQGFKLDAMLHPTAGPDSDAFEMLGRAAFWYSQLNLIHAWAIRAAHADADPNPLKRKLAEIAQPHPLMRYAADLSLEGLERARRHGPDEINRWVWGDEGEVVSEGPGDLVPEAAQLVGEIVVLLNLNESGSFERRQEFGEGRTMPYCLTTSRNRTEFGRGCNEQCTLRLCPYQPTRDRLSAHREISRAFCRDQRLNAKSRTARRWGSSVSGRSLTEFWKELESRALF